MPTKVREEIELIIENIGGGGGRNRPPAEGFGGGDEWRNRQPSRRTSPKRYYTGIAVAIIAVVFGLGTGLNDVFGSVSTALPD